MWSLSGRGRSLRQRGGVWLDRRRRATATASAARMPESARRVAFLERARRGRVCARIMDHEPLLNIVVNWAENALEPGERNRVSRQRRPTAPWRRGARWSQHRDVEVGVRPPVVTGRQHPAALGDPRRQQCHPEGAAPIGTHRQHRGCQVPPLLGCGWPIICRPEPWAVWVTLERRPSRTICRRTILLRRCRTSRMPPHAGRLGRRPTWRDTGVSVDSAPSGVEFTSWHR